MSKSKTKWTKLKDSYPTGNEEVEIQDSVGKTGLAIWCVDEKKKEGIDNSCWLVQYPGRIEDFNEIISWRKIN